MDAKTKSTLKQQIDVLRILNQTFKSQVGNPPSLVQAGNPPMPVPLGPVFAPYLQAWKLHADNFEKLLTCLEDVIAKS